MKPLLEEWRPFLLVSCCFCGWLAPNRVKACSLVCRLNGCQAVGDSRGRFAMRHAAGLNGAHSRCDVRVCVRTSAWGVLPASRIGGKPSRPSLLASSRLRRRTKGHGGCVRFPRLSSNVESWLARLDRSSDDAKFGQDSQSCFCRPVSLFPRKLIHHGGHPPPLGGRPAGGRPPWHLIPNKHNESLINPLE